MDSSKERSFELRFLVAVTPPQELLEKAELDHSQKPLAVNSLRVPRVLKLDETYGDSPNRCKRISGSTIRKPFLWLQCSNGVTMKHASFPCPVARMLAAKAVVAPLEQMLNPKAHGQPPGDSAAFYL